jgi:hypothetical protein
LRTKRRIRGTAEQHRPEISRATGSAPQPLPLAEDIDEFDFAGTSANEALIRDLTTGNFVAEQRNAVLIGGTSRHPV